MKTRIAVLGSTGSIGRQTLALVDEMPERYEVVALAAGRNLELLAAQIERYRPRLVSIDSEQSLACPPGVSIERGEAGLEAVATIDETDIVVVATSGHAAIRPTISAIKAKKTIALANKEAIVCAGAIILPEARRHGIEIRPVDSEHSAIWQCLSANRSAQAVRRVTLTASGGPFRDTPVDALADVSVDQALAHPNWQMGSKVTIDSATMMNKGLEVIEAHWLFDLPYNAIDVVIHPQSLVHSFVSFCDGSVLAQLAVPDMRVPIQYALTYPERAPAQDRELHLPSLGRLDFCVPDPARYPALEIARSAGLAGKTYPTVLSTADELAVEAFLRGRLRFPEIVQVVERVLDRHQPLGGPISLESITEADHWARATAQDVIERLAADRATTGT